MIDFTGIEKRRLSYEIAYRYVRYMHSFIFYRNFEIHGIENLPEEPFLIVSNHQNGLNDAMVSVFGMHQHRMVFIARGDIFKKDALAQGLKWFRVLPAFRVRDTGKENLGENDKIFNLSADILRNGGIIGLFPEAALQYKRAEGSFKKGFARIAFMTEEKFEFKQNLKIVPVANYYTNFRDMGHEAMINIGEPFTFEEFYDLYHEHPEAALRQLSLKAQERVRPLMLDMQDQEHFEQLDFVRDIYYKYMREVGKCGKKVVDRLRLEQEMVLKFKDMHENEAERFDAFIAKVSEYSACLKSLNLRHWIIGKKYNFFEMLGLSLLSVLLAPFYALCWFFCILPYSSGDFVKMKDKRMVASLRMGISIVVAYPAWFLVLFGLSFIIPWPWWCSFIFLLVEIVAIPFMSKMLNYMRRFYIKLHHRWRYFAMQGKAGLNKANEMRLAVLDDLKRL